MLTSDGGPNTDKMTGSSRRPFSTPITTSAVITKKKYLKIKQHVIMLTVQKLHRVHSSLNCAQQLVEYHKLPKFNIFKSF